MKKAFYSLLGASLFVAPFAFVHAAAASPLEEIKTAFTHQSNLETCRNRFAEPDCQISLDFFRTWNVDSFQEFMDLNMVLVQAAIAKDKERLKEIEDIVYTEPNSQHHYKQILTYGQLRIEDVLNHTKRWMGIVPDLKMFFTHSDLTKDQSLGLLKEKLKNLKANIEMALGKANYESSNEKTNRILEHARLGTVIYQVPASTDKVAGMLKFRCEEQIKRGSFLSCPANTLDVRFSVPLLKKILGTGKEAPVQIIIQKVFTEGMPVVDLFSNMLSGLEVDIAKRTITVNYYEYTVCGADGRTGFLDKALCNDTLYTKKQIESRKNIEEALFNLIGETDQSLKLYLND